VNTPDGRYDRMAPGAGPLSLKRPWQSNEERLVTTALEAAMLMPADEIRALKPPLPQIQLFPPRFGYPTEAPGILDVVNLDRQTLPQDNFSGTLSNYSGASRNSLGDYT
jgi:hypothetical protein